MLFIGGIEAGINLLFTLFVVSPRNSPGQAGLCESGPDGETQRRIIGYALHLFCRALCIRERNKRLARHRASLDDRGVTPRLGPITV